MLLQSVLEIMLVTDDVNMIKTADEFDIEVIKTISLLKLMVDNKKIDKEKVKEIIEYWYYLNDLPANFHKDFRKEFNENPPPDCLVGLNFTNR